MYIYGGGVVIYCSRTPMFGIISAGQHDIGAWCMVCMVSVCVRSGHILCLVWYVGVRWVVDSG